jgi:uncharacterized protein YydD (DUF2326 family)
MKIKRISSNYDNFRTVKFNDDFSVIVGDSQKNKDARSHNLGKTTIIRIIRFVLFNDSKSFFDKIAIEKRDLQFDILLQDNDHDIFLSRNMAKRKKNDKKELETIVDYEYFIRFQNEFDLESPFKKEKYRGADVTWKPRLIGLLGFNKELLYEKLVANNEVKELENAIKVIQNTKVSFEKNNQRIEALAAEKKELELALNDLNMLKAEQNNISSVVNDLDIQINIKEIELFHLQKEDVKISHSLEALKTNQFDISEIESIYNDAEIFFSDALQKNINDLKEFYIKVSQNRKDILSSLHDENHEKKKKIISELDRLNNEKTIKLQSVILPDSIAKYKQISTQIIQIEQELFMLKRDVITENLDELKEQLSLKKTESFKLSAKVAEEIDKNRTKFEEICSIYSKIVKETVNIDSKIEIVKRNTGNIDLVLKSFRNNSETDELKGATAKKISSAAVDIAIRAVQNEDKGFIIQDGVIDEIDSNAALKFVSVVKSLVEKYHFQYIMTAIKDKLPANINEMDIIIELNDYNDSGLLFGRRY